MANNIGAANLLRYAALGLPLAFAGLPIYVHVPKFYGDVLKVNLAQLGEVLLFIRLFDAIFDPLVGMVSDRYHQQARPIMAASIPLLILGYILLFNPPSFAHPHPLLWLAGCLVLVYTSFSTLMVNYYAMGISLARDYNDHTRVAAFRESGMLVGVLLASILPSLLMRWLGYQQSYALFSLCLAPLLLVGGWLTLTGNTQAARDNLHAGNSFFHLLRNSDVRYLLLIGFCNAVPTAITSTLFLFFTTDVLRVTAYSGALLALYFVSAAGFMPLWSKISFRLGKKRALLIAMLVAIACFIGAWWLQAGDLVPFAFICICSGATLGADTMLLPSMLSDRLAAQQEKGATGFGLWNFTSKLTMACAAGIVLPLLAAGGYHSGQENSAHALRQLSFCYALLPCLCKAIAATLLYFSPLERKDSHD